MLEHKKILFINLSKDFETRERTLLNYLKILDDRGIDTSVLCFHGSPLDKKLRDLGCKRIHYKGRKSKNVFNVQSLLEMSEHLKANDFDLIHSFDEYLLWPLSFLLRKKPLVPFVYSLFNGNHPAYSNVWHKMFFRRVDNILVPSVDVAQSLSVKFPVKERVFKVGSYGTPSLVQHSTGPAPGSREEQEWVLGVTFEGKSKITEQFKSFLGFMNLMSEHFRGQDQVFGRPRFKSLVYLPTCYNQEGLDEELKTLKSKEPGGTDVEIIWDDDWLLRQKTVDLWLVLPGTNALSDHFFNALAQGRPVLIPRMPFLMEQLEKRRSFGESYRPGDFRELKAKCLKILEKYSRYRASAGFLSNSIYTDQNVESLSGFVLELYKKLLVKRQRLFSSGFRLRGKNR